MTKEKVIEPFDIKKSIRSLLKKSPLLGYTIVKMKYEIITDDSITPTCGITKDCKLLVNKNFMSKIEPKERVAVLMHEALHVAHKHFNRLIGVSQPQIAMLAKEISINQYIEDLPGLDHPTIEKFNLPKGNSLERYYKLLLDFAENNPDKADKVDKVAENNPLKGDCKEMEKSVAIAEKICKDAKEYAKGMEAGNVPGANIEEIEILPTNYKAKINKLISYQTSQTKLKRTNLKGSKRFKGSPGLKKSLELNDVIFGLDTSASMSKRDIGMAVDAIQKFRRKCKKLTVIQGDTKVTDVSKVKKNIKSLLVKGRGGTELTPILYKAKEYGFPKVPLVMFTDGEVYNFPDKNKLKNSLWVFTRESSARRFSKDRQGIPYAVML
jgi:predicted metal-dependent peptidase